MSAEQQYRAAVRDAEAKKARFLGDVQIVRERVQPARLKAAVRAKLSDSVHDAQARTQETVKEHPFAFGAAVAGIAAYLFRRPLAALSQRAVAFARDNWPSRPEFGDDR